jgi:hypothetical protein
MREEHILYHGVRQRSGYCLTRLFWLYRNVNRTCALQAVDHAGRTKENAEPL